MCCSLKNWPPKAKFHGSSICEPVSTLPTCDIPSWSCKPSSPCPSPEPLSPPNPQILLLPGASKTCHMQCQSWAPVPAFVPDCSKFLSPREMTQGFCTSFQRAFFYLPPAYNACFSHTSFPSWPLGENKRQNVYTRQAGHTAPCRGFACGISAPSLTKAQDL